MRIKALQLTRCRRAGGLPGLPAGGRPVARQERRPPAGVPSGYTGGAQLSAGPLGSPKNVRGRPSALFSRWSFIQ